jgi:hypothetical protein
LREILGKIKLGLQKMDSYGRMIGKTMMSMMTLLNNSEHKLKQGIKTLMGRIR